MAITDDFNRASLGSTWETVLGSAWQITRNEAAPSGLLATTAMRRAEGNFAADQYAQAKCQVVSAFAGDSSRGGVAVRLDVAGNGYYWLLSLTDVSLWKRVAGVSTQIGTVAGAKTSGTYYTLKLVVNGSSLTCYLNGEIGRAHV